MILQLSKANKILRVTSSVGQNCAIIASNSMVPFYALKDLLVHNKAVPWLPPLSPMGHSTSTANCIFLFSFITSLFCNSSLAYSVIHSPSLSFLIKLLHLEPLSDCRYIFLPGPISLEFGFNFSVLCFLCRSCCSLCSHDCFPLYLALCLFMPIQCLEFKLQITQMWVNTTLSPLI